MWVDYLIAVLAIAVLLIGWIVVQRISHRFALAHPEFGPPREEGAGCGKSCGCSGGGSCKKKEAGN